MVIYTDCFFNKQKLDRNRETKREMKNENTQQNNKERERENLYKRKDKVWYDIHGIHRFIKIDHKYLALQEYHRSSLFMV